MPRALRTNGEIPIWLPDDAKLDPRPTFYFKALDMDEEVKLGEHLERETGPTASNESNLSTFRDMLVENLSEFFIRSDNMDGWGKDDLKKLTLGEGFNLVRQLLHSSRVTPDEKKSTE